MKAILVQPDDSHKLTTDKMGEGLLLVISSRSKSKDLKEKEYANARK